MTASPAAPSAARTRPRALVHSHSPFWAFVLHRVSGVVLTVFLPAHFYVMALAATNGEAFAGFLAWTANPLVKLLETGLVGMLAVHLAGGLRLMALELLPWRDNQKALVAAATGFAVFVGLAFLLNATL